MYLLVSTIFASQVKQGAIHTHIKTWKLQQANKVHKKYAHIMYVFKIYRKDIQCYYVYIYLH